MFCCTVPYLITSFFGWLFVGVGTVFFSAQSILLWPVSLIFEGRKGELSHQYSQLWARLISRTLPFWRIQSTGLEKIKKGKPYVIVSNHQSLLDILVVLDQLPLHFKFIAKRELFWIPFLGWHLFLAGYIPLKRGDADSGRRALLKAQEWLKRGVSVLFFPEGTRSLDGQIREFKPGAFKLALETGTDILPLVITGTREAIPKHSWIVRKRALLSLRVLDPISMQGRVPQDLESIRSQVRTIIMREIERLR